MFFEIVQTPPFQERRHKAKTPDKLLEFTGKSPLGRVPGGPQKFWALILEAITKVAAGLMLDHLVNSIGKNPAATTIF